MTKGATTGLLMIVLLLLVLVFPPILVAGEFLQDEFKLFEMFCSGMEVAPPNLKVELPVLMKLVVGCCC